jgi:peroxiredoxin
MAEELSAPPTLLNQPAPAFEVPTSQGTPRRLTDYRGTTLLLGFFPLAFTGG